MASFKRACMNAEVGSPVGVCCPAVQRQGEVPKVGLQDFCSACDCEVGHCPDIASMVLLDSPCPQDQPSPIDHKIAQPFVCV